MSTCKFTFVLYTYIIQLYIIQLYIIQVYMYRCILGKSTQVPIYFAGVNENATIWKYAFSIPGKHPRVQILQVMKKRQQVLTQETMVSRKWIITFRSYWVYTCTPVGGWEGFSSCTCNVREIEGTGCMYMYIMPRHLSKTLQSLPLTARYNSKGMWSVWTHPHEGIEVY